MHNQQNPVPCYGSDIQLAEFFGVSRATIWRWTKEGRLPQPVRISAGCTRWRLDQIELLQGGVA